MSEKMRLNKYISDRGVSSRRKADELIQGGYVEVNGVTIVSLGTMVDPDVDIVVVKGILLDSKQEMHRYIMLNKPKGVTSTSFDPHAEKTVMSLVSAKERLYPVGRLDKDSRGLLLLTNDGELAFRLTHPRFAVGKRYRVAIKGIVKEGKLAEMRKGVELEDGIARVADVSIIAQSTTKTVLEMTLSEGKKREIRRICAALHLFLIDLQRISIGSLNLGILGEGTYRDLTTEELTQLRKDCAYV